MRVRAPNPTPPFGAYASSLSVKATPAMPRCTHGVSPTNSRMKRPAVMAITVR